MGSLDNTQHSSWIWFCGEPHEHNNTNFDPTNCDLTITDQSASDKNDCAVNSLTFFLHVLFILILVVIWIVTKCRTQSVTPKSKFLIRYPGHVARYMISFILLFVSSCAIAEGVLTDKTFSSETETQPQLYLPACCACVALILSLVYYQYAESNCRPHMCWYLLIYWVLCVIIQVLRLMLLKQMDLVDVNIARFWLDLVIFFAYFVLLVLEIRLLYYKVRLN